MFLAAFHGMLARCLRWQAVRVGAPAAADPPRVRLRSSWGQKKPKATGDVEEREVALVNRTKQTLSGDRIAADAYTTEFCHRLLSF